VAIKSKRRTKSRQVARAPRREPVIVKRPFFLRRWVQLIGAALGGAAVVLVALWVVNGLNRSHASSLERRQQVTKLAAAQKWKSTVEGVVSLAQGTLGQGLAPPTVFPTLGSAISTLQKGSPGRSADLKAVSEAAGKAADTLDKFDLAGTISGKGFTAFEALEYTSSKSQLTAAFRLFDKSARLAQSAAGTSGSERVALAKAASGILTEASTQLSAGWATYEDALSAGGVPAPGPLGSSGGAPPILPGSSP
jgi:hypothetical protein